MKKYTYCVEGMHCAACETLIRTELQKKKELSDIDVSLANRSVSFRAKETPSLSELHSMLNVLGYRLSLPAATPAPTTYSWMQIFLASIFVTTFFILISETGITDRLLFSTLGTWWSYLILGVVASLSTCAALTGGLLIALSQRSQEDTSQHSSNLLIQSVFFFMVGRIVGFTFFGLLLGIAGSWLRLSVTTTAILITGVSAVMLVTGLQMLGFSWAQRFQLTIPSFFSDTITGKRTSSGIIVPFTTGAATFFLPCSFTLIAQTAALATGNPLFSSLMMLAFVLGTTPVLLLIGWGSVSAQRRPQLSTLFYLVAGVGLIGFAFYNMYTQSVLLGFSPFTQFGNTISTGKNSTVEATMLERKGKVLQIVEITAKGFGYTPRSIILRAGIPAELTVRDEGVAGCARAMAFPGLSDDIVILDGTGSKTVSFTPRKAGTYSISCTMGMVPPIQVKVI